MTLTQANAATWIDGEIVTPAQINHMGAEYELAIDGENGGRYTPSSAITLQGRLAMAGTVRPGLVWRRAPVHTGNISVAFDSFTQAQAITTATDVDIDSAVVAPATGNAVSFVRGGHVSDTSTLTLQRNSGTDLVTVAATLDGFAEAVWDGSNWRTVAWGGSAVLVTM